MLISESGFYFGFYDFLSAIDRYRSDTGNGVTETELQMPKKIYVIVTYFIW